MSKRIRQPKNTAAGIFLGVAAVWEAGLAVWKSSVILTHRNPAGLIRKASKPKGVCLWNIHQDKQGKWESSQQEHRFVDAFSRQSPSKESGWP